MGVRENLNEGIEYLAFWIIGTGCCVVNYLMADAATCEVSRTQLWIWLKYKAKLNDGRTIDEKLIHLANKHLPTGTKYELIDESVDLSDRSFRNAWEYTAGASEQTSADLSLDDQLKYNHITQEEYDAS